MDLLWEVIPGRERATPGGAVVMVDQAIDIHVAGILPVVEVVDADAVTARPIMKAAASASRHNGSRPFLTFRRAKPFASYLLTS